MPGGWKNHRPSPIRNAGGFPGTRFQKVFDLPIFFHAECGRSGAAVFDQNREVNSMLASEDPNPEALADAEYLFYGLGGEFLG
ncbi:MAG: hypothetical protein VX020_07155, partial [SAR324 cluster bacterium]|nr:hypothetical protein [SAR324 cluster bacterium]